MQSIWTVVGAAACIVPAAALAAAPQAPKVPTGSAESPATSAEAVKLPLPKFSKVDTNGDGWIEWKEAKAAGVPRKMFEREDHGQPGRLSITEWKLLRLAMIKTPYSLPKAGSKSPVKAPAPKTG